MPDPVDDVELWCKFIEKMIKTGTGKLFGTNWVFVKPETEELDITAINMMPRLVVGLGNKLFVACRFCSCVHINGRF